MALPLHLPPHLSATCSTQHTHKIALRTPTSNPTHIFAHIPHSHPAKMSEAPKLDPAAQQSAAPGATLVKDETEKVTTGVTEAPKPAEEKPAASAAETVTNAASTAAAAVKDNVFSMFGGGPKKEKKAEADDADEPSGVTKKAGDVSAMSCAPAVEGARETDVPLCRTRTRSRKSMSTSTPLSA